MKEELTTKMHSEFFGDEFTQEEWAAMGVYGAQQRGVPLEEALSEYGLSEARYRELESSL